MAKIEKKKFSIKKKKKFEIYKKKRGVELLFLVDLSPNTTM